jgi:hypothetical protein
MAAYVTLAEAAMYFAERLYVSEWQKASPSEKTAALAMAQRSIDAQPLLGLRVTTTQTDAFPRMYAVRVDRYNGLEGNAIDTASVVDTVVPQCVKDAVCEEALAILKYGDSERVRLQEQGVTSASRGDLHEVYAARHGLLSPQARDLLRPWLLGVVSLTT